MLYQTGRNPGLPVHDPLAEEGRPVPAKPLDSSDTSGDPDALPLNDAMRDLLLAQREACIVTLRALDKMLGARTKTVCPKCGFRHDPRQNKETKP